MLVQGVLDDLKAFGFKTTAFVNNHSADFYMNGLMNKKERKWKV